MGVDRGIRSAMNDHRQKIAGPHFLFSAENPKFPENNALKLDHPTVLAHLKGAGYDAHEVNGHYGAPEKSIVVYGVHPQHAEQLHGLAAKLGQDSSIYSTGQKHEMRYHHGVDAGKKILGQGTVWHKQKPADFFTSLPGGSHHFTHNFDFSKPVLPNQIAKSEMGINSPIIPTPTDTTIVFDQAASAPGAIELFYMKYPDHVVIEKDRNAIDSTYLICQHGDIEKWKNELGNYAIDILEIKNGPMMPETRASDNVQYGVTRGYDYDSGTINNAMLDKKEKIGTGVANDYRKKAMNGGDVLWKVKIKGRDMLTKDIPLHMSLKVFDEKQKIDLDKIKKLVKELNIKKPDSQCVKYYTKIHHSDFSDTDYFMLMFDGCDPAYKKFYDALDGVKYKEHFMHVTIDKPLYDQINKEGLKPHEIEFDNLSVEKGAGNTIYEFPDDSMEKSFKTAVAGTMVAASSMMGQPAATPHVDKPPQTVQAPAFKAPTYTPDRMLHTIESVESSGGKDTHHKRLHSGEQAYGKYALTPNIIRETIKLNPGLSHKHAKAEILRGPELQRYMHDNPGLEDAVAQSHLKRLESHFGNNPQKIGYAWLEGIRGTYKALQNKQDINNHWHVKKITQHYQGDK